MKFSDILYRREYKIQLISSVSDLDLNDLNELGSWSCPVRKCYFFDSTII